MKRFNIAAATLAILVLASAAQAQKNWSVDPVHSTAIFSARHFNAGNVWGRFNEIKGDIAWDDQDPGKSSFNLTVNADSLDTHNQMRDNHLKGPDFFNVKQYGQITFKSTSIKKSGENYEVTGDLTIKGATKPITVQLTKLGEGTDPRGTPRIGFETRFTINRSDFGVSGLPGGVGEQIPMIVAIEATGAK
jgi:polyisoprenoid-binding protein YceI